MRDIPMTLNFMRGLEIRIEKLLQMLQRQRHFLNQQATGHFLALTQQISQLVTEITRHWAISAQWRRVAPAFSADFSTEEQWQYLSQLLQQAGSYQQHTRVLLAAHLDELQHRIDNLRLPPRGRPQLPTESEAVMINTQV